MIKIQFIGHIGNDAIVNDINGKKVINFNAAHSEYYVNKDGVKINKSIWVSFSYWTDNLKILPYLKKGVQVYIEGFPYVDTYVKDNKVHYDTMKMQLMDFVLKRLKEIKLDEDR